MAALAQLLGDGPYKKAEVQTKGGAAQIMSSVAIKEVDGRPGTVDIYHVSEGLRMMRERSRRKSGGAGGDAGGGAAEGAGGASPAG